MNPTLLVCQLLQFVYSFWLQIESNALGSPSEVYLIYPLSGYGLRALRAILQDHKFSFHTVL